MATSAVIGMIAAAAFVTALIMVITIGKQGVFGRIYPPVLDEIGKAALYIMGVAAVGVLISAGGFIVSLFTGTKPTKENAEE